MYLPRGACALQPFNPLTLAPSYVSFVLRLPSLFFASMLQYVDPSLTTMRIVPPPPHPTPLQPPRPASPLQTAPSLPPPHSVKYVREKNFAEGRTLQSFPHCLLVMHPLYTTARPLTEASLSISRLHTTATAAALRVAAAPPRALQSFPFSAGTGDVWVNIPRRSSS